MVAELRDDQHGLTEETVARWVQAYIDNGKQPVAAAALVLKDIRDSGLQDDALEMLGPLPILWLWRERKPQSQPEPPSQTVTHQGPTPIPVAGPRRVQLEPLRESTSLLEGMYQIGDQWLRIGDMDKAACRAAAQQFKATAIEHAHQARYFHEIAKTLNGGETVRQRFDDASLMRLWEVAKRSA